MPNKTQNGKGDAKRPRLTLSELASYDDICTDALVDNVFFWSTIRKNRAKYNSGRGFSEEAVTKILFDNIVCNEDAKSTEAELLRLGGFKKFLARLTTPREQEDFKRHLRKYISIWLPDCPWEVTTTNRYTVITHEAAVVARRPIRKGETIHYLCGTLVEMTTDQEKDLDLTRRDFSIVTSSRNKKTSLFLGPARFANHDCRANARLSTTASWGMAVVAVTAINEGEEITVTYGDDYFGEENCECLCGSCEKAAIGGWTKPENLPEIVVPPTTTPAEQGAESYALRHRQRLRSSSQSVTPDRDPFATLRNPRSRKSTQTPPASPMPKRGRGRPPKNLLARTSSILAKSSSSDNERILDNVQKSTSHDNTDNQVSQAPPLLVPSESEIKREVEEPTLPRPTPTSFVKEELQDDTAHATIESSPTLVAEDTTDQTLRFEFIGSENSEIQGSTSSLHLISSQKDEMPSRKRSREVDTDDIGLPSKHHKVDLVKPLSLHDTTVLSIAAAHDPSRASRDSSISDSISDRSRVAQAETPLSSQTDDPLFLKLEADTVQNEKIGVLDTLHNSDKDSDLSDLASDEDFDDQKLQIVQKRKRRVYRKKNQQWIPPESSEIPRVRYPGDYLMTPILLAEPYSRWVQCKTCQGVWVQANGYCTRRECPRCERHSKLYGYRWPTVHDDNHERVIDHREVHRFLSTTEEHELRRKAGMLVQ